MSRQISNEQPESKESAKHGLDHLRKKVNPPFAQVNRFDNHSADYI